MPRLTAAERSARFNTALEASKKEQQDQKVDLTFVRYKLEEKNIRLHREQQVAAEQQKLSRKLYYEGATIEMPKYFTIDEKRSNHLMQEVERLEQEGASTEAVREAKRNYIRQCEVERRARAPTMWDPQPAQGEKAEPHGTFSERYRAAILAAAVEAEKLRVDSTCTRYRAEEEAIQKDRAKKTARLEKQLAKTFCVEDIAIKSSDEVQAAEELVAKRLERLKEYELDIALEELGTPRRPLYTQQEIDERIRPMRQQYIDAVKVLRALRAPHLYGTSTSAATSTTQQRRGRDTGRFALLALLPWPLNRLQPRVLPQTPTDEGTTFSRTNDSIPDPDAVEPGPGDDESEGDDKLAAVGEESGGEAANDELAVEDIADDVDAPIDGDAPGGADALTEANEPRDADAPGAPDLD